MVKELIEGIVKTSNYFFSTSDTGFLIPPLRQRENSNIIRILKSCCSP